MSRRFNKVRYMFSFDHPRALLAAGAVGLAVAAPAAAEPVSLSFNLGAATDYVWRGVSQTNEDPQVFGGVDAAIGSMGYAGIWASNIDYGYGTDAEVDLYAGVRPRVGPVTLDLGVTYYGYVGLPSGIDRDFVELKAGGSMPLGPAVLGAVVAWSDDYYGHAGNSTYYEVNGSFPVGQSLTLSGAVGRQDVQRGRDYNTWNLGASYAVNDVVGFDLRYHDTSEHDLGDVYDSRVVLGVKAAF